MREVHLDLACVSAAIFAEAVIADLRRALPCLERLEIVSVDMRQTEFLIEVEGTVSSGE